MVMIQSSRVKKKQLFQPVNKSSSDAEKILRNNKLPNIEKAKIKKSSAPKRNGPRKSAVETQENELDSRRLPPLEPAHAPLPVPQYMEPSLDADEELWDGIPDISDLDDYLDGRESGLSMGSLWSNQTDLERAASSLGSWGEDEFDQAASKGVADMFSEIDSCLYEGKKLTNNPGMASECQDWSTVFPHLRIIGKQILPSEEKGYRLYPRPPSVTLAAPISRKIDQSTSQTQQLEIQGYTVEPQITPRKTKKREETLAEHGTFEELIALDYSDARGSEEKDVHGKERRHSEPVLYSSLPPKSLLLPSRRSPVSLSFKNDKQQEPRTKTTNNNGSSIRFSAAKSRQVSSVGAKNKGRLASVPGTSSAGAPRRLNPIESVSASKSKSQAPQSTQKSAHVTHFSKLPPIEIPDPQTPRFTDQRTATSHSLHSAKQLKRRSKTAWQSATFDSTLDQYNLSPRKHPLQKPSKLELQRKEERKLHRIEETIPPIHSKKPPTNVEKKKLRPSKSASPRRKVKSSSNIKTSSRER